MSARQRRWGVLFLFAILFTVLEMGSIASRSATWDEPVHLTAGYLALTQRDYRLDPTHPPLLRMWAALPLAFMDVAPPDSAAIDGSTPDAWLGQAYIASHDFLYRRNDADRLLNRARLMVIALGVALGCLLFVWIDAWLGFVPALLALAFYIFEPNLLAHASLVTTDFGVTLFIFAASYLLWRTCRTPASLGSVAGLTVCVALASVSKSSGLLLAGVVPLILAIEVVRGTVAWRRATGILLLTAIGSVAMIWAVYGFRYAPSDTPGWIFSTQTLEVVQDHARPLAAIAGWIDAHHLLPNAFTQGVLYGQATADDLPAYFNGEYSHEGWWYYFPSAFALKTPSALLVLVAIGLVTIVRRRREWPHAVFLLIPPALFFVVAVASGINVGVRHILPIYPFAIAIAACGANELLAWRPAVRRSATVALAALWLFAFVAVYPNTLTFFSLFAGGPSNGLRYLADSNLDWGQHLKQLAAWLRTQNVAHVNLAYFGTADPSYYDIDDTLRPGSPAVLTDRWRPPSLPGYVAVSATVLSGVYGTPASRLLYSGFNDLQPVADIGHSIRVYWIDRWPERTPAPDDSGWAAERGLADSLLFEQGWFDHAIVHYRRYLQHQPDDEQANVNLGIALLQSGNPAEALASLRRAVARTPKSAALHRVLAAALCEHGSPAEAEAAARRAVSVAPRDAAAHDILGRALALQERWREATEEFSRALAIAPDFHQAREHLDWIADANAAAAHQDRPGQIRSR
jgi:tetratricopeptide (TPR) repeat protein